MRIISKKAIRTFWAGNPAAQSPLTAWYKITAAAVWRNFAEVRRTFATADLVGNCVVFNIGGNKYRLVARIFYETQTRTGIVYILRVMTHAEYDDGDWTDQCGCHNPPPERAPGPNPPRKPGRHGPGPEHRF